MKFSQNICNTLKCIVQRLIEIDKKSVAKVDFGLADNLKNTF